MKVGAPTIHLLNPDRQGGEEAATTYLITWACYGAWLPGREGWTGDSVWAAIQYVVREQGRPAIAVFEMPSPR